MRCALNQQDMWQSPRLAEQAPSKTNGSRFLPAKISMFVRTMMKPNKRSDQTTDKSVGKTGTRSACRGRKDITDYLKIGGNFPILLEQAKEFLILSEPLPEFKGIGDREAHIKHYRQGIDALMHDIRKANNSSDLLFILKKLRLLMVVIDNLELEIRKVRREKKPAPATVDPNHIGDDDIAPKEVPIEELFSVRFAS